MSRSKATLAVLVAAVAGALASSTVANAQGRLELTPFAGYYIASDLYTAYGGGNNHSNVELTNSFMYGGRLTANSPRGAIEFAYTRTGSDIKINNLQPGQTRDKIGRIDLDNYDINFLGYQPSNSSVIPFGLVGFGWAVTHPEIDSDVLLLTSIQPKSHTLFNFNFGLGAKIQTGNPKLGLRLEGRWRVTDTHLTTSSGYWCDAWGYCYSYASDWYNSGEFTGGITYALGN
jgi:hypothetical protein